jgi:hypothetical protein
MSNSSSGVSFPTSLRLSLIQSLKSSIRPSNPFVKLTIKDGEFQSETCNRSSSTFSSDFDSLSSYVKSDTPCFFVFYKSSSLPRPLIVSFIPESSSVKDRMVYSSSKGALNSVLNDAGYPNNQIDQYHATSTSELRYSSYKEGKSFDRTLVMSEVEIEEAKLEKELSRSDFKKSAGYGLIAQVSGKPLPPQLKNYGESGSNSGSGSGGFQRVYGKPSDMAKKQQSQPQPTYPTATSPKASTTSSSSSSSVSSAVSSFTSSSSSSSSSFAALRPGPSASAGEAPKISVASLMKNFSVQDKAEDKPVTRPSAGSKSGMAAAARFQGQSQTSLNNTSSSSGSGSAAEQKAVETENQESEQQTNQQEETTQEDQTAQQEAEQYQQYEQEQQDQAEDQAQQDYQQQQQHAQEGDEVTEEEWNN